MSFRVTHLHNAFDDFLVNLLSLASIISKHRCREMCSISDSLLGIHVGGAGGGPSFKQNGFNHT